jgi:hypothetical protein
VEVPLGEGEVLGDLHPVSLGLKVAVHRWVASSYDACRSE